MIRILNKCIRNIFLTVFFIIFPNYAFADCSAIKIQKLSDRGVSISDIAEMCHINKKSVLAALNDDSDSQESSDVDEEMDNEDNSRRNGAPSGTVLSQCGCWGYEAGNPRKDQRCQSGYSTPLACAAFCPAGGFAWGVVCM